MIKEDYISYETAKLLNEKGFVVPYDSMRGLYINGEFLRRNPGQPYFHNMGDEIIDVCSLQLAMKWLREVYGLFIRITEDITGNVFEWSVYQKNYGCKASTYVEDSYEQACETAIKYCLKNLI